MPPTMKDVYSSHVRSIGHDPTSGELHVRWQSGRLSIYGGPDDKISAELARTVSNSHSVGKALDQHIKPSYPHRYSP